jgi:hypothetical protein
MKYFTSFFLSLILLFTFTGSINSQILDSEYVRENVENGAVLGVETEKVVEEEILPEQTLETEQIIDILAVLGGVVLIALFAYIAYSKKDESNI